jgi:MFS family permease
MSVIVYACALVGINLFAQIADRMNRRGIPLIAASTVALVGYVLLLAVTNDKARLASTCILAFGLFATIPISATWLVLNIGGYTKRGSASAIMNMVAQAFAIIGTQAFTDPPFCKAICSLPWFE